MELRIPSDENAATAWAAAVSMPVTWDEVCDGCEPEDFTMVSVPQRLAQTGDLSAYPRSAHARV